MLKENNYDIINSKKYKTYSNNDTTQYLSLCLFCDGTPLIKSKNVSMWIMLSSIMELPQRVRESKQNILIHSIIIGNTIDFNKWFLKCEEAYANRLGENFLLNGYRTRLFCTLFDLPARAKALNMVNHNGYNACINCDITGVYKSRKVIFPFRRNLSLRTEKDYKEILGNITDNSVNGKLLLLLFLFKKICYIQR